MKGEVRNGEGIVLRSRQGREGSKVLTLFSVEKGKIHLILPRPVMAKWGSGLSAPFALIRFTASFFSDYAVLSQYEGWLLFDMMKLSYEEMCAWYYLIELADQLFPLGEKDETAYHILLQAGKAEEKRNGMVVSFIASVKLLGVAGFDAASPEEAKKFHLSQEGLSLLTAFRQYRWGEPLGRTIPRSLFQETAAYVDAFIRNVCDVEMNTQGAYGRLLEE